MHWQCSCSKRQEDFTLACIYLMPFPARGPHYSTKSLDQVYDVSGTASTLYHNRLIFRVPFISRLWHCRGFRLHQFIWKISRAIDVGATNPLTLRMLSQYMSLCYFPSAAWLIQ